MISFRKCNAPIEPFQAPVRIRPVTNGLERVTDWSSTDLAIFRTKCGTPVPSEDVKTLVMTKIFDGSSPFLGFPPELAKPYLHEKRIRGWGSTGTVFKRLLEEVKPQIILELGTYLGASAIHMATLAKSMFDHQILILCVDDFRGWPGFRDKFKFHQINGNVQLLYQFMQNVQTMNFTDHILPLPFSTTSAMSALCEWGVYADLIEVDAAHDFHSAWADINLGYSLLRPGGIMFGHDYYTKLDNRGVGRAVDLFAKLKGLRVEPDGQHWILRSK
ncbi:hypothetical protein KP509_01G062900 [Ceratopteris richardii]|nr:hypothetical protein KP509_01G062900 [Ceratopteris richardii]